MARQPIAMDDLVVKAHHLWAKQWLLLTVGDYAAGPLKSGISGIHRAQMEARRDPHRSPVPVFARTA